MTYIKRQSAKTLMSLQSHAIKTKKSYEAYIIIVNGSLLVFPLGDSYDIVTDYEEVEFHDKHMRYTYEQALHLASLTNNHSVTLVTVSYSGMRVEGAENDSLLKTLTNLNCLLEYGGTLPLNQIESSGILDPDSFNDAIYSLWDFYYMSHKNLAMYNPHISVRKSTDNSNSYLCNVIATGINIQCVLDKNGIELNV